MFYSSFYNKSPSDQIILRPILTEIDKFVNTKRKDILKVDIYQGPKRELTLQKVQNGNLDILICSYQTLAADLQNYKEHMHQLKQKDDDDDDDTVMDEDFIFDTMFHRIILDEAQNIRNAQTGAFKAVKALNAVHKLALTGTPFMNHPRDIHSLLNFLEVRPLETKDVFDSFVVDPIMNRKEIGLARLRVVMGAIAIRRTKEGK
jgi:SNF2 family DNA or RNA helicase